MAVGNKRKSRTTEGFVWYLHLFLCRRTELRTARDDLRHAGVSYRLIAQPVKCVHYWQKTATCSNVAPQLRGTLWRSVQCWYGCSKVSNRDRTFQTVIKASKRRYTLWKKKTVRLRKEMRLAVTINYFIKPPLTVWILIAVSHVKGPGPVPD